MSMMVQHRGQYIRICPSDNSRLEASPNLYNWQTRTCSYSFEFLDLVDNGDQLIAITSDGMRISQDGGYNFPIKR